MKYLSLERGSFGFEAAETLVCQNGDGHARFDACEDNLDVLHKAERGNGDFLGVVPIENSIDGYVPEVIKGYWLKTKTDFLTVVGEIEIPIRQCLLTLPGVTKTEGLKVVSHTKSLGQCAETLTKLGISVRVASQSNTKAVREIIEKNDPSWGAIASITASNIFGETLEVLPDIHDDMDNRTRFHIVSNNHHQRLLGEIKPPLRVGCPDRVGALRIF